MKISKTRVGIAVGDRRVGCWLRSGCGLRGSAARAV